MTAPWIAEAERAAAEALLPDMCEWHGMNRQTGCDDCAHLTALRWRDAAAAVAAVVPILAEHFAQAVERTGSRTTYIGVGARDGDYVRVEHAARAIREAATPTEGDTT
jgi:hypothetical protein